MALSIDFLVSGSVAATYSQSGTAVTVTSTSHGLTVGHRVYFDFTSGTAADAWGVVTSVTNANTFVATVAASATTSGNVTYYHNLGGAAGTLSVPSTEAIFTPSVTAATGISGITGLKNYNKTPMYRCIYVKNTYGSARTYSDLSISVVQQSNAYMTIDIAPSSSTAGNSASAIANEITAPSISGTWSSTANMGSLSNGVSRALWLRITGKDAGAGSNGGWTLNVQGKY